MAPMVKTPSTRPSKALLAVLLWAVLATAAAFGESFHTTATAALPHAVRAGLTSARALALLSV